MGKMNIDITSVSVSKKGTVYIQAKLIKPDEKLYFVPDAGQMFTCDEIFEKKKDEDKENE